VALSDGELYTVLTSKTARGRKGSIVAIIKGTQSDFVITHPKGYELDPEITGTNKNTCTNIAAMGPRPLHFNNEAEFELLKVSDNVVIS